MRKGVIRIPARNGKKGVQSDDVPCAAEKMLVCQLFKTSKEFGGGGEARRKRRGSIIRGSSSKSPQINRRDGYKSRPTRPHSKYFEQCGIMMQGSRENGEQEVPSQQRAHERQDQAH